MPTVLEDRDGLSPAGMLLGDHGGNRSCLVVWQVRQGGGGGYAPGELEG